MGSNPSKVSGKDLSVPAELVMSLLVGCSLLTILTVQHFLKGESSLLAPLAQVTIAIQGLWMALFWGRIPNEPLKRIGARLLSWTQWIFGLGVLVTIPATYFGWAFDSLYYGSLVGLFGSLASGICFLAGWAFDGRAIGHKQAMSVAALTVSAATFLLVVGFPLPSISPEEGAITMSAETLVPYGEPSGKQENIDRTEKPLAWGEIIKNHPSCRKTVGQSPINFQPKDQMVDFALNPQYKTTRLKLKTTEWGLTSMSKNAGHMMFGGKPYALDQIRVRFPAEHLIMGRRYAGELQYFHKDNQGRRLVVSVFLKEGANNPVLGQWEKALSQNQPAQSDWYPQALVPKDKHAYVYRGSDTVPPCQTGLTWAVIRQPMPISKEQVEKLSKFQTIPHRPTQSRKGLQLGPRLAH